MKIISSNISSSFSHFVNVTMLLSRMWWKKKKLCAVSIVMAEAFGCFLYYPLHSEQRDQFSKEMIQIKWAQFVVDIFTTWSFQSWVTLLIDAIDNDFSNARINEDIEVIQGKTEKGKNLIRKLKWTFSNEATHIHIWRRLKIGNHTNENAIIVGLFKDCFNFWTVFLFIIFPIRNRNRVILVWS